jgi:methylthioribose-1-phosphate isomerase
MRIKQGTPPELVTAIVTEYGVIGSAIAGQQFHEAESSPHVPLSPNTLVEQEISDIARSLYARGWMPGTAGNISVRSGDTAVIRPTIHSHRLSHKHSQIT